MTKKISSEARAEILCKKVLGSLREDSDEHFYCEECEALILVTEGVSEGESPRIDSGRVHCDDPDTAPLHLAEHAKDCVFTRERVELGLESPLEREIRDLKERVEELEAWTHITY